MKHAVKEPYNLSPRIQWLRDYYFKGVDRAWNNEFLPFTTGEAWDELFDEISFYIVPETHAFLQVMSKSYPQNAITIPPPKGFYQKTLAERRAWFNSEAIVNYTPAELLPGDLLCGARFNLMCSRCWSKQEAKARGKLLRGKNGLREDLFRFHGRGLGNCGATSGHLIPDYAAVLQIGFRGIAENIQAHYDALSAAEQSGAKGAQLRAMLEACNMPRRLAAKYAELCAAAAAKETDPLRKKELLAMQANMKRVPWEPAVTFWEAVQALWFAHMLVLSDENYPGAGVSFGRIDQYLLPYWERSVTDGMDPEFGKEILKCFWVHCNTAYDAMIRTANNGITAGYGQLFNLSGLGADGKDMTNDLTYIFLDVIDEMSPILEPKPNVRLHRNSPEKLMKRVAEMISSSQGAPFLLNFDERSMAGMLREAKRARCEDLINLNNVHDYASVGCLENTMVGNDRSGTVDCNINLLKAVEWTLGNGEDLIPYVDSLHGKPLAVKEKGVPTGDPAAFADFDAFYAAFELQLKTLLRGTVALYNRSDDLRAQFSPTPYLSCLVRGCAEKAKDITAGGAELRFVTLEGVTFASTVDSLLAVQYLVYDKKLCTIQELIAALKANWEGFEVLRAHAVNRAPKYGRDDDAADALALRVMDLFAEESWNYRTRSTDAQFRAGMLSWNYWISSGYILPASPDGRRQGEFLSNAICPVNGADTKGPTANANSVGKVLGGRGGEGDFGDTKNSLPNGASHTITINPALMRSEEYQDKFLAFLRGYTENGGTALQVNVLDPDMLRDAQKHPENYQNLLVRVTGYNAYFTGIGRELQNEIIQRESHQQL